MVAIGLGTLAGGRYETYTMQFRKADAAPESPDAIGTFTYRASGIFGGEKSDYKNHPEYGVVITGSLAEGEYVIYNFKVFQNSGSYQATYFSRKSISIPFSIKKGTVAYLGNYQASAITGKNIVGMSVSSGAYFTVENRIDEQQEIMRRKGVSPELQIINFTPSPEDLKSPFFVTPAEREQRNKPAEN